MMSSALVAPKDIRIDHRGFIVVEYEHPVHVKDAIAAMEARVVPLRKPYSPKPSVKVAPSPDTNDQGRNLNSNFPLDASSLARKAQHRRSMSDPNLHKTFRQVKKLWDQKVELAKQPVTPQPCSRRNSNSSRRDSASSINSAGSSKSIDRPLRTSGNFSKESNEILTKVKTPIIKVVAAEPSKIRSFSVGISPVAPPRPSKSRNFRSRSNSQDSGKSESKEKMTSTAVTSSPITSSPSVLSVNEKAMLFGGTRKKSTQREEKPKQTGSPSPAFQRHRSDDSIERSSEKEKEAEPRIRAAEEIHIYEEVPAVRKKITTGKKLPNPEDICDVGGGSDDEMLVNNLRKNAHQAKERRKNMSRKNSLETVNPAADGEERFVRKNSFLNNARKESECSPARRPSTKVTQSPSRSPYAIQNTESVLFGPTSPSKDAKPLDDSEFQGRRRASSLHKLMTENKLISNPALGSQSSGGSPLLKWMHENTTEAGTTARPTNLDLTKKDRSHTVGEAYKAHSTSSDEAKPRSSSSITVLSSSKDVLKSDEKAPEPPLQSNKPTSGDSSTSLDSTLGDFNPEEEYDRIARQISGDDLSPSTVQELRLENQSSNSTMSVDSGFRNSLEVPSSNRSSSRGVNVDSWSDFDNSSDDDENIAASPNKGIERARTPSPSVSIKEPNEVKLHNIAKELLSTEVSYVSVLHLIDQVFHKQVREAAIQKHIIPEQVVNNIFCHVPAIYQFHSSFLLPQLKGRLENWEANPRIGDIMTQAAPFLKMYSLYVQNFDEAMNTIKIWSEKSNAFSAIIKSIQKLPESNSLTLQHHMLGPVQRVPRYRLLLDDYVKRLPETSEDRPQSEKALELITFAATHSNETMKKIEKFNKLVKVFNGLADVNFDIVDVSRELLKEGKIIKISARNGEKYERYLYLFSDMLLCCTPLSRLQGKSYRVTAKIDLDGMRLTEVKNPTLPHAFCVQGLQKSMEFASSGADEKETWVNAINGAILDYLDRKTSFIKQSSFKKDTLVTEDGVSGNANPESPNHPTTPTHHDRTHALIDIPVHDLGTRAPRWIKDNEVTMCMTCSKPFNKLLRRRHHCRACGKVVCSKCSMHETTLQYDPGKQQKVCEDCFNILTGRHQNDSTDGEKKGVLEIEADIVSENSVIADYLNFSESEKKKTWTKTWCVIPNDELCLYFYGAHQDVRAQMTLPLPGFEVITFKAHEHKYGFKLAQARKVYYFTTEDKDRAERWMYALKQASIGEDLTRDDVYRLGMPASDSSFSEGSDSAPDDSSPNEDHQQAENSETSLSAKELDQNTTS
ncbi:uncharacterized protein LOC143448385 isoform X2 [Clavelina lepadiformis]|uniref:uncharacterized protein LOC143448385 isoform X2 n=1 Tax=Clavelina lepadiformis TaxID=159417 RepID=UPI0040425161